MQGLLRSKGYFSKPGFDRFMKLLQQIDGQTTEVAVSKALTVYIQTIKESEVKGKLLCMYF